MQHPTIGIAKAGSSQQHRPDNLLRHGGAATLPSRCLRARSSTTSPPVHPGVGPLRAVPRDKIAGPAAATRSPALSTVDDPLAQLFTAEDTLANNSALDSVDLPADKAPEEDNPYTAADAASPVLEGVGEVELERLLAEEGKDLSVERLCKVFPYPLDNFQKKALEKFLEGQSVLVCAPTGAGKTAIAEAAAAATLARGQRVIYTTPLKALSNQKLFEMRKRFGHARCGLQTGDSSLNTEASVVVMTTEILRNIMYRIAEQAPGSTQEEEGAGPAEDDAMLQGMAEGREEGPLGEERENSAWMTREVRLADVGLVVMDEVHYLGDPFRGSVWEEAIINCPRHIQLLCMSATVKNPDDLGAWISKEHMPCSTIKTSFRPVPLHWYHAYTAPPPRGLQLVDLLSKDGRYLNQRLETKAVMMEEARAMMQRRQRMDPFIGDMGGSWDRAMAGMMEVDMQMQRKAMAKRVPSMEALILRLRKENLLPAIWFIMSRKDCDLSAVRAASGAVILTSEAEQTAIKEEVAALLADSPEAVREALVPALVRGMASHHAGHLPGWKSLVERLFQRGLLKIVFATGTLAAGINMPARTTIISALGRRTDDGVQLLPHNELLQMAGRAGRRGYDTEGFCCVLQTRFEGPEEAYSIIKAGPEPLVSHFNVSYGLVLNLLSIYSLEQARQFCNKSFGIYLRREGNARRLAEVKVLTERIAALTQEFDATASTEAKELNAAVKAAKDRLREIRLEEETRRMTAADTVLTQQGLPRKVLLNLLVDRKGSKGMRSLSLPAVLLAKVPVDNQQGEQEGGPPGSRSCVYLGLGADNRLLRVNSMHVTGWLSGPQGSMSPEDTQQVQAALERAAGWTRLAARLGTVEVASGTGATAMVALQLQQDQWQRIPLDPKLLDKMDAAKAAVRDSLAALDAHRARKTQEDGGRTDDKRSMDRMAQARSLQRRVDKLQEEVNAAGEDTWRNFTEVVDILADMGAIIKENLTLQPLGLVARSIQGQNELWLALVLTHPAMFGLSGPELAGVLGAILCGEVVRKSGNISAAYMASQRVCDAVNALEGQRQLMSELQAAAGLGAWNEALLLDLRLAGIVEAWAAGATWKQVVMDSGMDDGDIARLLIRTVDLIKQISWQKDLLPHLSEACFEALKGMDRKPIAETLM